jgi:hypothetical protein
MTNINLPHWKHTLGFKPLDYHIDQYGDWSRKISLDLYAGEWCVKTTHTSSTGLVTATFFKCDSKSEAELLALQYALSE